MKKKSFLMVILLASAVLLPLLAIQVQGSVDAGPDQTTYTGEQVAFNGTTTANQSSIVNVNWDFGDGSDPVNGSDPALLNETIHNYTTIGEYEVTLSVTDSDTNTTETDTLTVTVVENEPPVADAGPDQTVEQTSPDGAEVVLNASASSDPYDDPLTYNWTWTNGSAVGVTTTVLFPAGTINVTLTVSDGEFNVTDSVLITVEDTEPPYVDAGEDVTVPLETPEGTQVTLNGTAIDDIDIELDYVWSENGTVLGNEANLTYTFSFGSHVLTLNATDDSGNTGTDTVTVDVVDTTPPVVDAGEDATVEAGYETTIHGTATDLVDTQLDYVWEEGSTVLGTEADLTFTFTLGTHVLTLTATDDSGNTATDNVTIEAVDTTAPEISVSVVPDIMWPPNHKYADVETVVTVQDTVDPSPTVILVSVTSNEADNGKGDGNTTNDIVTLDDTSFRLRAERSGTGQGRIYTITYKATDASGNSAEASITITVPHNK